MNVERMQQAMRIIEQTPDHQLQLTIWQYPFDTREYATCMEETNCTTIACAAGWLCLHPDIQAQGLYASPSGIPETANETAPFAALGEFFGLGRLQAIDLFTNRSGGEWYSWYLEMTDRQLWLTRARELLQTGCITTGEQSE